MHMRLSYAAVSCHSGEAKRNECTCWWIGRWLLTGNSTQLILSCFFVQPTFRLMKSHERHTLELSTELRMATVSHLPHLV